MAAVDVRLEELEGLVVQPMPGGGLVLRAAVADVGDRDADRPQRVEALEVLELPERLDRLEEIVRPALDGEDRDLAAPDLAGPALVLVVGRAQLGEAAGRLLEDRVAVGVGVALARDPRVPGRDVLLAVLVDRR